MAENYRIVRFKDIPIEERGKGAYYIRRVLDEKLCAPSESLGLYFTSIRSIVPYHHHKSLDEVLVFLTPAKIKINGKEYEMESYDTVFLPRGTNHEICSQNEKEAMLIAIKSPNIRDDKITGRE